MSDKFLNLARLGQHSKHCDLAAQSIAVTLLLRRTPVQCDQVEAAIDALADDYGALIATLRAELGRHRADAEVLERGLVQLHPVVGDRRTLGVT